MMVFGLICVFIRIMSCFCTLDCILCRNHHQQRNQDKNDYLQMEELLVSGLLNQPVLPYLSKNKLGLVRV